MRGYASLVRRTSGRKISSTISAIVSSGTGRRVINISWRSKSRAHGRDPRCKALLVDLVWLIDRLGGKRIWMAALALFWWARSVRALPGTRRAWSLAASCRALAAA